MTQAIVFTEYGGPEVLRLVDVEPPRPAAGQVLVRVRAAGVQPFDNLFRTGEAARYMPATFPQQVGNELAGVIDAVGPGVTAWAVGDEVLGWVALAAFADLAVVGEHDLVRKPAAMPWTEAGALSASGQTAHTALEDLAVAAGETLLVHAAAGGVGSMAVQIARALGAIVIGTAGPRNHDYLRALGAVPVAYGSGLVDRVRALAPDGVHAVLDAVATEESLTVSRELAAADRIGTVGFNPLSERLGVRRLGSRRSAERLAELTRLWEDGALRVTVRSYPLDQAAEAHRAVGTGHVRGKVVLVANGGN